MDNASLKTWYEEDPLANHQGLMSFWNQQTRRTTSTLFEDVINNKAVIEVNGQEGRFTYDIPIEEKRGLYTEADMSHQNHAGIDGGIFYIVLGKELAPGTQISYDDFDGVNAVVSEEEEIEPTGTGYKHPVVLATNNKRATFPQEKLARGIEYFVVSHGVSEYGTKFANVNMPDTPGSQRFEFRLGSVMGVEAYVTAKADSVNINSNLATASTVEYKDKLKKEMDANGYGEFAVRMDVGANGPNVASANVGSTMEYLVMKQLNKMTGTKLLFQQAGEVKMTNGVVRFNDGLWRQARRGRIIEYGKPGGITEQILREAAEYIFRKSDLDFEYRRIKFKCGTQAYYNVIALFQEQVSRQVAAMAPFLGADRLLSKNPVTGNDLKNLGLEPVRFTNVYIPQLGMVDIERDVSLDYGMRGDRFEKGMHPSGYAHTTHSMIIWDASDQSYSNNEEGIPEGAKLVEGGNSNANIFLVKPEGPMIFSGRATGRYDSRKSSDIMATNKYMAEEFFAYNNSDVWLADASKIVMVELSPKARRGFN